MKKKVVHYYFFQLPCCGAAKCSGFAFVHPFHPLSTPQLQGMGVCRIFYCGGLNPVAAEPQKFRGRGQRWKMGVRGVILHKTHQFWPICSLIMGAFASPHFFLLFFSLTFKFFFCRQNNVFHNTGFQHRRGSLRGMFPLRSWKNLQITDWNGSILCSGSALISKR